MDNQTSVKKHLYKGILALFALGLASTICMATSERTRTVERSFKVPGNVNIELTNKYGPVVINTWDNDSVKIKVDITAFGKNLNQATKTINRIDIDFNNNGDFLTIESVFDRSSGFFKELWNNIGDYSQTLLSRNKLRIEYEVYVPSFANLDIENKFGDVYLSEMSGRVNVDLSHGNLRANNLNNSTTININFGDATIKSIDNGVLIPKVANVTVQRVGRIDIESSSSTVHIKQANRIKMSSVSDKGFRIDDVRTVTGKSNFSKITIGSLTGSADLNMNYGEININNVRYDFSRIDLTGKSTDMRLTFHDQSYLAVDLETKEDRMDIPRTGQMQREYIDDKEKYISVTGFMGIKSQKPGALKVDSFNGDLEIRFAPPSPAADGN